jgi:hypothetical protein
MKVFDQAGISTEAAHKDNKLILYCKDIDPERCLQFKLLYLVILKLWQHNQATATTNCKSLGLLHWFVY